MGEKIFIDKVLPFGLRSAPKIFNALADALEWVARSRGVRLLSHYLDDFTVVEGPRIQMNVGGAGACSSRHVQTWESRWPRRRVRGQPQR